MHLGIDNHAGLVYEGLGNPEMPVVPTPNITQAKLIENDDDWNRLPTGFYQTPTAWVFREDSFDAVTRTRRGRLYASQIGAGQPNALRVSRHPYEGFHGLNAGADGRNVKTMFTFHACTELIARPDRGRGCTIALGSQNAASTWRIIDSEFLANGCVLITLKSLSAFGMIPNLNVSKVNPEFKAAVSQAMDRVLNSAFRETPISVIDHCRNAMTVLISCWLVQDKGRDRSVMVEDLGPIATLISKPPYDMGCLANLASLVARLHSRGKGNEQHRHGVAAPVEEDAQLAIEALGFTLREIQWHLA
jgi:hypothetical protein